MLSLGGTAHQHLYCLALCLVFSGTHVEHYVSRGLKTAGNVRGNITFFDGRGLSFDVASGTLSKEREQKFDNASKSHRRMMKGEQGLK